MTGYAIEIAGEFLELYEDQEVNFSEEAPLLSEKTLPGMISLPALFPNSTKNRRMLGNLSDLQVWEYEERHACTLHLFGAPYCQGFIILNDVTRSSFEFQFTEFDAFEDFNDKKLADLEWPSYDLSINDSDNEAPLPEFFEELTERNVWNVLPEGAHENVTKDFVAPTVYNPAAVGSNEYYLEDHPGATSTKTYRVKRGFLRRTRFLEVQETPEAGAVTSPFQNLYIGSWDFLTNDPAFAPSNNPYTYAPNLISPMLFVSYIVRKIFEEIGFDIRRYDLSSSEWHNLIVYINRGVTLYNKKDTTWNKDFFRWEPSYTNKKVRPYEKSLNLAHYTPNVSISEFLTTLRNTFNLAFIVHKDDQEVSIANRGEIINQLKELDITSKASLYEKWSVSKSIGKQNLKWLGALFDDTKRPDFNYKGKVNAFADLPSEPSDGDTYMLSTGALYKYIEAEESWRLIFINNLSYLIDHVVKDGIGSLDLKSDYAIPSNFISTDILFDSGDTGSIASTGFFKRNLFIPQVQQSINTESTAFDGGDSGNDTLSQIVFLLYRGMALSPEGPPEPLEFYEEFYYPYASSDNREPFNILPSANGFTNHLQMYGSGGLYETFHRKWQEAFSKTRTVFFDLSPDPVIWQQLFTAKLRIDNQLYIGSRKTLRTTPSKVKSCQLEALQIIK